VALPLLLAGPILRRVEPTLVCVWVALSESATLKLTLWEGRVNAGSANAHVESAPEHQDLRRIGEHLFVGVVRLKLDAASPKKLQPGRSYSYDLTITPSGSTAQTLASLGLLATGVREGKRVEALGFEDGLLPSFALPPEQITDLRVVFGSCRRVANDHLDAFVYIDDLMRDAAYSVADPLKRPHQLFLGGDQIYADDVSPAQMAMIIALARELIGSDATGGSRERLPVDHIRRAGVPAPAGFDDYGPDVARGSAGSDPAEFLLPADAAHFPPGRRYLLSTVDAQMTSIDGRSHLFALGEFAAMYLMVWSNAVWPAALPDAAALITPAWPADRIATFVDAPFDAAETRGVGEAQSPFNTYTAFKTAAEEGGGTVEQALARHATQLTTFERGLAKVRRVLANVPTYMIFDDHDLTDDWNLNPIWYDRVMATSLGTATLRNGLVAYALFQDWGNDPERYRVADGEPKKLLDQAVALFAGSATPGPAAAAANEIDKLLGLNLRGRRNVDGSVDAVVPPLKWHFSVPGPKHLAVALDNRTRRSFVSVNGPPGNVAKDALAEQVPAGPLADGKEVLLVVAPLQVLGPPLLDEVVAPAAYKVFDMVGHTFKGHAEAGRSEGSRGMTGTNPDAIEAWAFDAQTMEALLERLAAHKQVVLLSGDVHYSASDAMSYFTKGQADPARLVQFTSSGMKNVMPSYLITIDRSLTRAQALVRADIGAARLGWKSKPASPMQLPAGKSEQDIPRALRAKLRHEPVLLPTYGWPRGTTVKPEQAPDWSWRVEPVYDIRADAARPEGARPLVIDADAIKTKLEEPGHPRAITAYQELAARHQRALETLRNSRQILFRSNVGVVRFERRAGVLHAVHEVYTSFKPGGVIGSDPPKAEAFMVHAAALAAPGARRPELDLQPLVKNRA
jgi:hypothetical protein